MLLLLPGFVYNTRTNVYLLSMLEQVRVKKYFIEKYTQKSAYKKMYSPVIDYYLFNIDNIKYKYFMLVCHGQILTKCVRPTKICIGHAHLQR